jgi:hypothetical protein
MYGAENEASVYVYKTLKNNQNIVSTKGLMLVLIQTHFENENEIKYP